MMQSLNKRKLDNEKDDKKKTRNKKIKKKYMTKSKSNEEKTKKTPKIQNEAAKCVRFEGKKKEKTRKMKDIDVCIDEEVLKINNNNKTKNYETQAKARGTKLGGLRENAFGGKHSLDGTKAVKQKADEYAMTVGTYIRQAQKAGQSLRQICQSLNDKGIKTARGGQWYAGTVRNMISRLDALGV